VCVLCSSVPNMSQLLNINLSKGPGTSWGFRLQGGKDFAQPLSIAKVNPGSVAALAGIQAGDAIVKIGSEDALALRHKEAQDAILRAGNSFVMQVQRGSITWKPAVTALAQPKQTPEGPVATKTSLAAPGKGLAPTKATNGTPSGIAPTQYNSPIGLYTDENIAEALSAQAEVLNKTPSNKQVLGINFRKFEREVKLRTDSPTYQMLHGDDSATAPKPRKQLPPPDDAPVQDRPVFPSQPGNPGYYNVNDKLYCDVHAKQAARANPPAPNMVPVTVKPGDPIPRGATAVSPKPRNGPTKLYPSTYFGVNPTPYKPTSSIPSPAAPTPISKPCPAPAAPITKPCPAPAVSTPKPCPPPGTTSINPNAFGAVAGGVDIRSHIPKKDPVAPAPIQRVAAPTAQAPPTQLPAPAPSMFGSAGMPAPTSIPGMGSVPPKPTGIGAVPNRGVPGERTAPKRGRGVMNAAVASRIPVCANCQAQIRGPFVTALGKNWCPDCFCCATTACRKHLLDVGFVEEQGNLHCEDCYEKFFAPTCGKCDKRIKGDCLNAVGKQFHPECFCCAYCGKVFGSGAFYLEDGLPYCETDWNELFTTKCVGCGFPIEAGDRWVEALNNNYHSQCFKCSKCNKNLEGQSFYAKGGKPFCKSHAQRGF